MSHGAHLLLIFFLAAHDVLFLQGSPQAFPQWHCHRHPGQRRRRHRVGQPRQARLHRPLNKYSRLYSNNGQSARDSTTESHASISQYKRPFCGKLEQVLPCEWERSHDVCAGDSEACCRLPPISGYSDDQQRRMRRLEREVSFASIDEKYL